MTITIYKPNSSLKCWLSPGVVLVVIFYTRIELTWCSLCVLIHVIYYWILLIFILLSKTLSVASTVSLMLNRSYISSFIGVYNHSLSLFHLRSLKATSLFLRLPLFKNPESAPGTISEPHLMASFYSKNNIHVSMSNLKFDCVVFSRHLIGY